MRENLRKPLFEFPKFVRASAIGTALVFIIALSACDGSAFSDIPEQGSTDGLSLVWEAWDKINQTYVSPGDINIDVAVSGAMSNVLELIDVAPYPFLADVGRMRGQAPGHVPAELADLWRAVAKYQASNQKFDPSIVAQAAVTGLVSGLADPSATFLGAIQYPLAKAVSYTHLTLPTILLV